MNIIIRADSGFYIGTGHIMRCLNLAYNINTNYNVNIEFIVRNHEKNINNLIEHKTYILDVYDEVNFNTQTWLGCYWEKDAEETINILENKYEKIDLLIIDHYSIDYQWENRIRPYVKKIMVIDDLANRKHNCDVLLDQNISNNDYLSLVPKNCKILCGLKYLLINNIFLNSQIQKKRNRINICFGGIDNHNLAEKIFNYLNENMYLINKHDIVFDIISEKLYQKYGDKYKAFNIYPQLPIEEIAKLLESTYLSIGASGMSVYERCLMNIYNILITTADNQLKIAENIGDYGIYLGHYNSIDLSHIIKIINNLDQKNNQQNKIILDKNHYHKLLKNIF